MLGTSSPACTFPVPSGPQVTIVPSSCRLARLLRGYLPVTWRHQAHLGHFSQLAVPRCLTSWALELPCKVLGILGVLSGVLGRLQSPWL